MTGSYGTLHCVWTRTWPAFCHLFFSTTAVGVAIFSAALAARRRSLYLATPNLYECAMHVMPKSDLHSKKCLLTTRPFYVYNELGGNQRGLTTFGTDRIRKKLLFKRKLFYLLVNITVPTLVTTYNSYFFILSIMVMFSNKK